MKKLYIFISLYLSAHILSAQRSDVSNMYPLNYYLINSAATGKDSTLDIFTGYRKQWNGISNSPSQGYLGISSRIGRNHGAGLLVEQSAYGLVSDLNAKLSYAYHFRLSPENSLHAGASLGFINRRFQSSEVIDSDYSDDLLTQNSLTGTGIVSDIGIMFTSQRLLIRASIPEIIRSKGSEQTGSPGYYIFHGSYDVISSETWKLQTIAAYRKTVQEKGQADGGLRVVWKDQYGGGIGYRTVGGLFLRAEMKVLNRVSFAYGYEQGTSFTGKSHEVMVSLRFERKKRSPLKADAVSEPVPENLTQEPAPVVTIVADTIVTEPKPEKPIEIAETIPEKNEVINSDSVNTVFENDRLIFFQLRSSDDIFKKSLKTGHARYLTSLPGEVSLRSEWSTSAWVKTSRSRKETVLTNSQKTGVCRSDLGFVTSSIHAHRLPVKILV